MTRILVVEDDADTRALLIRRLRTAGHGVTACKNAEDALAALTGEPFDALVVDVKLPGMDGYEMVRRARADGLSDAPVVIATITDTDDLPGDVAVAAWLAKPFTRRDIEGALEALSLPAVGG